MILLTVQCGLWSPMRENKGHLSAFQVLLYYNIKIYSDIVKINSYISVKINIPEIKQIYHLLKRNGFQIPFL